MIIEYVCNIPVFPIKTYIYIYIVANIFLLDTIIKYQGGVNYQNLK